MASNDFINNLFLGYENDVYSMMIYVIGIVVYSIIVWNFYKNLSKRDLIKFNLYKFDIESPSRKFSDIISYFVKYVIITPIYSFFWFALIAAVLFVMAKSQSTYNILLISITLIGATRITSYYHENLAEDLAKVVPFALLAIFVIDPTIFNIQTILDRFKEIFNFVPLLIRFFIILVFLEFILRFFYEGKELIFGSDDDE